MPNLVQQPIYGATIAPFELASRQCYSDDCLSDPRHMPWCTCCTCDSYYNEQHTTDIHGGDAVASLQ